MNKLVTMLLYVCYIFCAYIVIGKYVQVYRGTLPNGQLVAIKRSQKQSNQGGPQFKAEIELLSRVHHKNLVSLVGFCFERGEQIIVYEFVPNGNLKDSISGRGFIGLLSFDFEPIPSCTNITDFAKRNASTSPFCFGF